MKHMIMPVTVGTAKETSVHLRLWVSFFIVRHVVPHGQCISEKSITQTAVSQVQPWLISSVCSCARLLKSIRVPVAI